CVEQRCTARGSLGEILYCRESISRRVKGAAGCAIQGVTGIGEQLAAGRAIVGGMTSRRGRSRRGTAGQVGPTAIAIDASLQDVPQSVDLLNRYQCTTCGSRIHRSSAAVGQSSSVRKGVS